MQVVAVCHALDGLDLGALGFDREHEARAHHSAVDHYGAGAAIAGGAALLGAGEHQLVAQHVEQGLLRLAQELVLVAVDRRRDVILLAHQFVLARSSACSAVRLASTPATLMRYSLVPRLSSIGRHAALAACASLSSAASSSRVPTSASAASLTSSTVGATAPSANRAAVQVPPASSVRLTPTPTTAMSISVRGVKR